jgi:hypothetical protein
MIERIHKQMVFDIEPSDCGPSRVTFRNRDVTGGVWAIEDGACPTATGDLSRPLCIRAALAIQFDKPEVIQSVKLGGIEIMDIMSRGEIAFIKDAIATKLARA